MYPSRTACSRSALPMRLAVAAPTRNRYTGTAARWSSSAADSDQEPRHVSYYSSHKSVDPPRVGAPSRTRLVPSSVVASFNDGTQRPGASTSGYPASHSCSYSSRSSSFKGTASADKDARSATAFAPVEWEITGRLKEISQSDLPPLEKLQLFQKDVWSRIKEFRRVLPKHLYVDTSSFLLGMCRAVTQQSLRGASVPLSKMLGTIKRWELGVRNELVLSLCHALVNDRLPSAERRAVLSELLHLWKHLSQLRRPSQAWKPGQGFVLPDVEEIIVDIMEASTPSSRRLKGPLKQDPAHLSPITWALASIFIQFRHDQACELVPGLLATLAVLSDPRLAWDSIRIEAAPLLSLVSVALEHQPADGAYVHSMFSATVFATSRFPSAMLSTLREYVPAQWPRVTDVLLSKDSAWRHGHPSRRSGGPSPSPPASNSHLILQNIHRQLRAAYKSRNMGAVISVWKDLTAQLSENPRLERVMGEDPDFLDFWVFVWCAVKRPQRLHEALELMQKVGLQPTVRTYTSMMHGWKMHKDVARINALWQKLIESGMQLDDYIWTARISGLIEAGRPQEGIHALAEMQAQWKKAATREGSGEGGGGAVPAAVQPTIEVVNAALKGLITLDRQAANEVLAWAAGEGIKPNIRTFNIIIRESLRSSAADAADEVNSLLASMKAEGLEPDAATFTIILEELLGGLEGASAAEQVQVVDQILADMRTAGLRANNETYGKMLYAVSSLPNGGADEAIAAVKRHMRAEGLAITPHMVTTLIERALTREAAPRDLGAAVRAILAEHNLTSIDQADQTLWERVMSAHAVTGHLPSAMDLFRQLAHAGRPVTSLPCLADLLKVLLASDAPTAPQEAREVVSVVLNHRVDSAALEGKPLLGQDERYWLHHFWYLARENSLIDWSVVPPDLEPVLRGRKEAIVGIKQKQYIDTLT